MEEKKKKPPFTIWLAIAVLSISQISSSYQCYQAHQSLWNGESELLYLIDGSLDSIEKILVVLDDLCKGLIVQENR